MWCKCCVFLFAFLCHFPVSLSYVYVVNYLCSLEDLVMTRIGALVCFEITYNKVNYALQVISTSKIVFQVGNYKLFILNYCTYIMQTKPRGKVVLKCNG